MLASYINYFAMIFYPLILFARTMNYTLDKKLIIHVIFSIITAFTVMKLAMFYPEAVLTLIIILTIAFNKLCYKNKLDLTIMVSSISCGICYAFYICAGIILSLFFNGLVLAFSILIFMLLPVTILFKVKRLKEGFSFLGSKKSVFIGALISITLPLYTVFANVIINHRDENDTIIILVVFGVILSVLLTFIWWRTNITRSYRDGLVAREIKMLEHEVQSLTYENKKMAAIIHADNKLIPALISAVHKLAENEERNDVLSLLKNVLKERTELLKPAVFIKSGNISLDIILNYMSAKAAEDSIEFLCNIEADIRNFIAENDLRTLTADLLDNAINAVKSCDKKIINLTINTRGITISDSGKLFPEAVLQELSRKNSTGIGMIEVFKVLDKIKASLIINNVQGEKFVRVRFDGRGEFHVMGIPLTHRAISHTPE